MHRASEACGWALNRIALRTRFLAIEIDASVAHSFVEFRPRILIWLGQKHWLLSGNGSMAVCADASSRRDPKVGSIPDYVLDPPFSPPPPPASTHAQHRTNSGPVRPVAEHAGPPTDEIDHDFAPFRMHPRGRIRALMPLRAWNDSGSGYPTVSGILRLRVPQVRQGIGEALRASSRFLGTSNARSSAGQTASYDIGISRS